MSYASDASFGSGRRKCAKSCGLCGMNLVIGFDGAALVEEQSTGWDGWAPPASSSRWWCSFSSCASGVRWLSLVWPCQ